MSKTKSFDQIEQDLEECLKCFMKSKALLPYIDPQKSNISVAKTAPIYKKYFETDITFIFCPPLTKNDIESHNTASNWTNQNFVMRLYAVLEYHKIISGKKSIDKSLPYWEDIEILRRLRNHFAHKNNTFDMNNNKYKNTYSMMKEHYNLDTNLKNNFDLTINKVLIPMFNNCKEYAENKFNKIENSSYNICCSKEKFNDLKTDERFINLLTLARVLNALNFCHKPMIDSKNSFGPVADRSTINSFLFASCVLYEGFISVEKLGKNIKNLDSFKNGFGALLKDKKVKEIRESVLKKMRDKFVFHFDRNVARESLENFKLPEYNFASGVEESSYEIYYGLADEVALNYFLEPSQDESDESIKKRFGILLQDIADIIGRFNKSAEKLLNDVLFDIGFTRETHE